MNWKIDEAQQKFSELLDAAVAEPQLIYNQDKLVAAVVEAEIFQEFLVWQQQHRKPSLADAFAQFRQLCAEENYNLEVPSREDRPNSFLDSLRDISL
jgi:antitoxin (DNA-binding transcriptional repressor) of toxin-antitoxin stability system